jgi:hypothetical protein
MNLKSERIRGKLLARSRVTVGVPKVGVFGVPRKLTGQCLLRLDYSLAKEIRGIEEWRLVLITLREQTDRWSVVRREALRYHPADLGKQEKGSLEPVHVLYVNVWVVERVAGHGSPPVAEVLEDPDIACGN